MRIAIDAIINLTDPERYCVAIQQRNPELYGDNSDYELHLYLRDPQKSGMMDLILLAHAIEEMGTHFMAVETTYDAGTKKGEDIRNSVKIW